MIVRKHWVTCHCYAGLLVMLLLLVNALTGSLITFAHEIDAWLNPTLLRTGHVLPALPADVLIERVEHADRRYRIGLFPLDVQAGESAELRVLPRIDPATGKPYVLGFDRVFIDPATGAVLGQRQWGALKLDRVHLMTFLDMLHRKFHLPGQWGMWLTGGVAIVWLLLSLLGAWLTLPKMATWHKGFWQRWKPAWQIKRGASSVRTTFDLHRSAGLWSLPVALMLAISGVYFSLGNEVFRPVVRWFSPITPHPVQSLPKRVGPPVAPAFSTQAAVARARHYLPPEARDFLPWYASHIPQLGSYRIAFKEDGMRERVWQLRYEQVFINDQTGELQGMTGYDSGSAGDRFLIWQYPLHTGRILGLWGRVLVFAAGIVTVLLCVTGLMVWWQRRRVPQRVAQR
ncbi:PepSY domain-containing protein [Pigmentiphaga aceris]|uniref:PepSY domain-containing protein n=1 Tax=Pigmentiphaga aceris TaxID=1940612 RepID=A0A5C0AS51_9BURK|nr:PepSY-associated TM helix domain-containing protein [Pigmentiphaga aceris]QEI04978.1 PepSY domain-containing protein [Pigmentiphaga aceris]